MSVFAWIILGLIAGFIASKIVNSSGQGLLLDMVLGIVGAVVGGYLFTAIGVHGGNFQVAQPGDFTVVDKNEDRGRFTVGVFPGDRQRNVRLFILAVKDFHPIRPEFLVDIQHPRPGQIQSGHNHGVVRRVVGNKKKCSNSNPHKRARV